MPSNKFKCCEIVQCHFTEHFTCNKNRPPTRKYGSFLNRYIENDSPFVNKKYQVYNHLMYQHSKKEPYKKALIQKELSPSIPTSRAEQFLKSQEMY